MATNPFEKYLQNDLADFAGLRISGTLPVKQEILNDLLQSVLADMRNPAPPATAPSTAAASAVKTDGTSPSFDPRSLVKHLKKAEIRVEDGRVVLNFDAQVDG